MNLKIYSDHDGNAIRFSNFKKLELDCPFSGLGVKYVASGEEVYFANDKRYKISAGEYIIGNEFTKSIVQIDHVEIPCSGSLKFKNRMNLYARSFNQRYSL
jgi:hypothetical protein